MPLRSDMKTSLLPSREQRGVQSPRVEAMIFAGAPSGTAMRQMSRLNVTCSKTSRGGVVLEMARERPSLVLGIGCASPPLTDTRHNFQKPPESEEYTIS